MMTMKAMTRAMALGAAAFAIAAGAESAGAGGDASTVPMSAVVARILVCPGTIAPSDCDEANAYDVIAGPPSASEIGCGVLSQQMLAIAGVAVSDGQYVKIGCVRRAERTD